ncbi:kinase-like protein, partial [Auricularia subglabra TFB-10046 SS5]
AASCHPLPMISEDEAMRATYLLADFGCAQPSKLHANRQITAVALRPPEVYLGAEWDMPADIWTFGCMVYEIVAGRRLFLYETNRKWCLTPAENMLYQMLLRTGERAFSAEQLRASPRAREYFSLDGRLKNNPDVFHWPIEALFRDLDGLPDEYAATTATFMRRCLRLNPADRATAAQLLEDEWFADAA